jgi:apolipoprotein N-acyltransferase
MASQSTEHSFITLRQEPQTLVGEPSHRGGSESTASPQDSCGSHHSTTRCPSTADTSGRSWFRRFDIICARCNRVLHTRAGRCCLLLGSGFAVGALAWSGHLATIPLSLLILLLLGRLETRKQALALMVSYYAGATWQVIPGAATFWGHHANLTEAVSLWAGASLLLGLVWVALWSKRRATTLCTVPITISLLAVPPLGLIGVASPLIAAGALFPGTGWFGLMLTLLICGLLASYPISGVMVAIVFSLPAQVLYHSPEPVSDWHAVSTHFGGVGLDATNALTEYTAAQSIQETALSSPAHVVVFPETVVSNWNEATDAFWGATFESLKREGKTILVGANVSDARSRHYFNSIVIRGANRHQDFHQRIPIPIAMWTPGCDRGVPLRLDGPGTLSLAGRRAAVLICYEQLLMWPAITSFRERPDLLLGTANDYWADSTTVSQIQRACLTCWARLFHIPMLWAENT